MFFSRDKRYNIIASEHIPYGTIDGRDIVVEFSQNYVHFFLIPFVALPKKAHYYDKDGNKLKKRELNPAALERIQEIKAAISTPKRYFVGLIILIGLVSASAVIHSQEVEKRLQFLDDPQPHDAYLYAIHPNMQPDYGLKYSYYIVNRVEGDQVIMSESSIAYGDTSDARKDLRMGFENTEETAWVDFQPYEVIFSKDELKQKYEKREIIDVDRNEPPYLYELPGPQEERYTEAEIYDIYQTNEELERAAKEEN